MLDRCNCRDVELTATCGERQPHASTVACLWLTPNERIRLHALTLVIANTVAYMLARSWKPLPINDALLEQDGLHLPQTQRASAALSSFQVADAMTTLLVTLSPRDTVASALARVESYGYSAYPVVDDDRHLCGLMSAARLRRYAAEGRNGEPVPALARTDEILRSDQPLVDAAAKMSAIGARQMAVLDRTNGQLVGVLAMSDVMRAHAAASEGIRGRGSAGDSLMPRSAVASCPRNTSVPVANAAPRGAEPSGADSGRGSDTQGCER
ncbi:MAG: hypothetical protein RL385_140 [Pseudomonadota bacterium]|jgi:CBS domain-containing protein